MNVPNLLIHFKTWMIGLGVSTLLLISGCAAEGTGDKNLLVRLQNDGGYPVVAFYVTPTGSIAEGDENVANWGVNHLTVPRLDAFKYVVLKTIPRKNIDGLYVFDAEGTTQYLRRDQLRADWLYDDCITFMVSLSESGSGGGHQWGCSFEDPENEVKPNP